MAKYSVKKEDYVMIIAGKDKGKTAQVTAIDTDKHRVLVEGNDLVTVNTKAVKARKANEQGGLVKQPGSVDISNVMPICAACGKPTRVGIREEDGKRVRYCKKCGATLVTKKATKAAAKKTTRATVRKKAVKAEAPADGTTAE